MVTTCRYACMASSSSDKPAPTDQSLLIDALHDPRFAVAMETCLRNAGNVVYLL